MTRLEALEAKLKAREGRLGYEANVAALKAEIARLKQDRSTSE